MGTPAFKSLLQEAKDAHARIPALRDFCAFPDDLADGAFQPRLTPAAKLLADDGSMIAQGVDPLAHAFVGAAADAQWRLSYEGTNIGQDFLDHFGCYCLIGAGGPWVSQQMSCYVVYMPPGLHYPWHHHPAEEIYIVLAGEAEFLKEGEPPKVVSTGGSCFHASNQPHATDTHGKGIMAYVLWRNHLKTPPVLTEREVGQP